MKTVLCPYGKIRQAENGNVDNIPGLPLTRMFARVIAPERCRQALICFSKPFQPMIDHCHCQPRQEPSVEII